MSVFDIFGDRGEVLEPKAKNLNRIGLLGNENLGKTSASRSNYTAPIKPNELLKKQEMKKSFLVNKGATLQNTPLKPGTPFGKANLNAQPIQFYSEVQEEAKNNHCDNFEAELEFHKPMNQYDNLARDIFDDMAIFSYGEIFDDMAIFSYGEMGKKSPRMETPEPDIEIDKKMEFNYSYDDDFFKDDFSDDSIAIDNSDLPSLVF